jgi:predicted negative regulator of RcsB-dependent stress response
MLSREREREAAMPRALDRTWRTIRTVARWARRHLALWILAAGAIDTALMALVGVLISLPGQSGKTISSLITALIVLLVLSVVFPVTGRMVDERGKTPELELDQRNHADHLLVQGSTKRLPRLSELTDDVLGVTPTRYSIEGHAPYVPRPEADEKVRSLLATPGPPYPFVIVWGTTKAGKSRTLAEALRATFTHDPAVVVPLDAHAIADFARLEVDRLVRRPPAVVVLDDLYPAGLETLTVDVLAKVRSWAVIAATMTAQRRADVLTTGGEVGAIARAALASISGEYELPSSPPTGAEKDEAERLYPAEVFDGSIAETLVGARELIARYKASYDTNPAGCAVVRAAIDVRRAGLDRPVTQSELSRLFPRYLHSIRIGLTPTDEQFAAGIEWATQPVTSKVALLRPTNTGQEPTAWTVFDHVVTADEGHEGHKRLIPAETWTELIEMLPVPDAVQVGFTANIAGNKTAATEALRKAAGSDYLTEIPMLAMAVGMLLKRQDADYARVALQQAIESDDAQAAALARISLGDIFRQEGDWDSALAQYQQAIDSGDTNVVPIALIGLGDVLRQQGDIDGARSAYQRTIDFRDTRLTLTARNRIRNLSKPQDGAEGFGDASIK